METNVMPLWCPVLLSYPCQSSLTDCCCSVTQVMSNCLRPHGLQHTGLPCPSTPRVCSNSCPSRWCHPTLFSCHPLLPQPSVFPSIRVFSNESALRIRWPKYWSFSFSIHLSNEYSVLISLRIEWFDLLAAQGTLKSLHHSSKASILRSSAFFMVQLSHPYMTTGKTIALAVWTFFGKVMSLLFNVLFQVCHSSSSKEQANNRMNLSYNFLTATISHSLLSMLEGTQLLFVTLTPEGHFRDHWADLSLLPGKLATTVMRISAVMWIRGHVPHLQAQAHYSPATVAK